VDLTDYPARDRNCFFNRPAPAMPHLILIALYLRTGSYNCPLMKSELAQTFSFLLNEVAQLK
jgi:hypothetical protein